MFLRSERIFFIVPALIILIATTLFADVLVAIGVLIGAVVLSMLISCVIADIFRLRKFE